MQIENNTYTTYDAGWIVRVRPAAVDSVNRVMLLIHGWTGDENSMWVFERQLPPEYLILAPRGPVAAPSGFGWAALDQGQSPSIHAYIDTSHRLMDQVYSWLKAHKVNQDTQIDLMGFSQGSAISFAILSQRPGQIAKTAILSGFMPRETENFLPAGHLSEKEIFVAHGANDETIPVNRAQNAVKVLKQAGARVTYCEENVGHKLGAACARGLKEFFG